MRWKLYKATRQRNRKVEESQYREITRVLSLTSSANLESDSRQGSASRRSSSLTGIPASWPHIHTDSKQLCSPSKVDTRLYSKELSPVYCPLTAHSQATDFIGIVQGQPTTGSTVTNCMHIAPNVHRLTTEINCFHHLCSYHHDPLNLTEWPTPPYVLVVRGHGLQVVLSSQVYL